MPESHQNLWPAIDLETKTPRELLEEQADALSARSQGVLTAHVEVDDHEDKHVLAFIIEAPRLDYRHILFRIEHGAALPYPAVIISRDVATEKKEEEEYDELGDRIVEEEVVSEGEHSAMYGLIHRPARTTRIKRFRKRILYPNAHSDKEFTHYLSKILKSPSTLAVINSLIARLRTHRSDSTKAAAPADDA